VAIFFFGERSGAEAAVAHSASGDLTKFIEAYFEYELRTETRSSELFEDCKELRVSARKMLFCFRRERGTGMQRREAGMERFVAQARYCSA